MLVSRMDIANIKETTHLELGRSTGSTAVTKPVVNFLEPTENSLWFSDDSNCRFQLQMDEPVEWLPQTVTVGLFRFNIFRDTLVAYTAIDRSVLEEGASVFSFPLNKRKSLQVQDGSYYLQVMGTMDREIYGQSARFPLLRGIPCEWRGGSNHSM